MATAARATFDRQLQSLQDEISLLGSMVEKAVERSVDALRRLDCNLAREVIAGDAAITFRGGDAADLAQKLERVVADPELIERHRVLALDRVRAEYDWNDVTARHRAVYGRVLAAR